MADLPVDSVKTININMYNQINSRSGGKKATHNISLWFAELYIILSGIALNVKMIISSGLNNHNLLNRYMEDN